MSPSHLLAEPLPSRAVPRAHLVGISGSGMKALAEVLVDAGWLVSGSDHSPDQLVQARLTQLGVHVLSGHTRGSVQPDHNVLIYSPAVPETNVERIAAAELNIPQLSYVDALAKLMGDTFGVAIAGTHGKSTTTAMLGQILKEAGLEPTVVCGAERVADARSGFYGSGKLTVVEACEYRGHFLKLAPKVICITGIEPDHFDCFPSFEHSTRLYQSFIEQLPPEAALITSLNCDASRQLKRPTHVKEITFSLNDRAATWSSGKPIYANGQQHCEVFHQGRAAFELVFNQPGEHNVRNALAAIAIASELGVTHLVIKRAFKEFLGLARRYQCMPNRFGARVIDDYAHHPTEIHETLSTARQLHASQRIVCVFQPHQVSRTKALFSEFVNALSLADLVYLLPVFGARESCDDDLVPASQALVNALQKLGVATRFIPALDQVWRTLETEALQDDLIFTLGAGDIARIHHERI